MSEPVVISIDAMGGDHGPSVVTHGVALAAHQLADRNLRYLLHGDAGLIGAELAKYPRAKPLVEVRHTDLVIAGDEKPAQALRRGKGSSLWNTIQAVKDGEAQGAVSGGNTGGLMAISKLLLRMAVGLDRPAIVASWPTSRGVIAVLDVGANITSDATQLVEFAIMGEAFHCAVLSKDPTRRPTVGLLNVGSEEAKGHESVREAHRLLREAGLDLDYRGFVEGDDIAKGAVDVVVTDGFSGNIALKTAEGMARFFADTVRATLTETPMAMLGAAIASGALKRMRAKLDPSSVNGGPLLGLNGVVVKSHGGADAKGFANAIKVAANLAASDYASKIGRNMDRLMAAIPPAHGTAESAK